MSLEENIKLAVENKLNDGTIENKVSEYVEKGIEESLKELFGWSGDARKTMEGKIKSVMVPYLENYDYTKYIVKLDSVLASVLNEVTKDNRKILSNFKELMSIDSKIKSVKVSDIFTKWCKYVSENVETDGLDIDYEGPHYESVEVTYEFEESEKRDWIKSERGRILFECEHDPDMNVCIDVFRWNDIHKKDMWNFHADEDCKVSSLRNIDEFKLYLMSLKQADIEIELDEENDCDYVTPEKEPEAYLE
ncbi:hypothetical protein OSC52_15400 [Clostridium pasteurianum]|uniref:hypothetical protein n=1 Tax=Clostridium pasteurianum TaxID=1501 RepID=UPI002261032A|nr:hypothetical protein [Clostridium pasteurianum]UZW13222.1 hypothetical protein OSC52_15400 [Clostridium pasteurianum]